jgi:hypothetical protein
MFPRLRRRRLLRWVGFAALSVALFVCGVWLALTLAGSSPGPLLHRRPRAPRPTVQYSVQPDEAGLRIHQQGAPGPTDLELKPTDQGVLITPAPQNK